GAARGCPAAILKAREAKLRPITPVDPIEPVAPCGASPIRIPADLLKPVVRIIRRTRIRQCRLNPRHQVRRLLLGRGVPHFLIRIPRRRVRRLVQRRAVRSVNPIQACDLGGIVRVRRTRGSHTRIRDALPFRPDVRLAVVAVVHVDQGHQKYPVVPALVPAPPGSRAEPKSPPPSSRSSSAILSEPIARRSFGPP